MELADDRAGLDDTTLKSENNKEKEEDMRPYCGISVGVAQSWQVCSF